MKCNEKIKHLRERKNLTQQELADIVGLKTASAINKIEMGLRDLKQSSIATFANALDVTPAELLDDTELLPVTEKVYSIPVFESVSAGFGALANESVVDYEAMPFRSASEAAETLFIRVKGDSMSPKIETGDLIQVRQQTSVDSGDIAVVIYEGEWYVKKVFYDDNSVTLHSLNPYYPDIKIDEKHLQFLNVRGKVKRIIKSA